MVLLHLLFILCPFLSSCLCSKTETLYRKTQNISEANFSSRILLTTPAMSHLSCTMQCAYWHTKESACNAYSYEDNLCKMAALNFLENPLPGETAKSIMVNTAAQESLDLYCRGGHHCCRPENHNLCKEGEGDCNHDRDCQGLLVCGKDNCGGSGGLWDGTDDCCEKKCTEDHPCRVGEGPCEVDTDCENHGWTKCGNNKCLNSAYFPPQKYPNNSLTFGFKGSDNCCHRVCNKNYNVCPVNTVGCLLDEDCLAGTKCNTLVTQPYCQDIDEFLTAVEECPETTIR